MLNCQIVKSSVEKMHPGHVTISWFPFWISSLEWKW